MAIPERACRACGATFRPRVSSEARGFYCGQECYGASKRTRVERTCLHCGATFLKKPVDVARGSGIYCSPACYGASKMTVPLADRVLARISKDGPPHPEYGACWLWTGGTNSAGYGHIGHQGKTPLVHRIMWSLASGDTLARGDVIGHVCDTPRCVRNDPEGTYTVRGATYRRFGHLFLGTLSANSQDAAQKDRIPGGRGTGRINDEQAREIFDRYHAGGVLQRELAEEYGISQVSVLKVVHGLTHRRIHETKR